MTPFLFSPKKKTLGTYWGVLRGQGKDWKKGKNENMKF